MPYRCRERDCRKRFSVRTATVMEASNLGFQIWAITIYLMSTSLKDVSSMKLHRDLEITQKTAWHLAMRLCKALEDDGVDIPFAAGPVEADETYVGGLEKNEHEKDKLKAGPGGVGKSIVVGVKDRETNRVAAKVIPDTEATTLHRYGQSGYVGMDCAHESVNYSAGQYVREQAHTNGIESFWSMLERGHKGVFHKFSKKAPAAIRQRVLWPSQRPQLRYRRPDAERRFRHGRSTPHLQAADRR